MSSVDTKKAVQIIQNIAKIPYIYEDSYLMNEFQAVIQRLQDTSFRIAIVGEFSSGKSTFINALIGKDILKHGVQETTATITEIVNDQGGERAEILFSDGTVKNLSSFDDLAEYTATSSKHHKVADEIVKVILHTSVLSFSGPVVFIDTPGLNGIADKHREKTLDIIQKSHACIYLLQKRGLGDSDTDFIKLLTKYQQQFLFVQNFIDTLQESEGETPAEKVSSQKKLLDNILKDCPGVSYEIVGVSALDALRAQDATVDTQENSEAERKKIYHDSNFDCVKRAIDDMVQENRKNSQQQRTAISVAIQRLKLAAGILETGKEQAQKDWDMSAEGQSQKKRGEIVQLLRKNMPVYKNKISNYITSESSRIERQISNVALERIEKVASEMENSIDGYTQIDALRQYMQANRLSTVINSKTADIEDYIDRRVQQAYTHLYQNMILQVQAYSGHAADIKILDFKQQPISFINEEFVLQDDEEIKNLEKEMEAEKVKKRNMENDDTQTRSQQKNLKVQKQKLQDTNQRLENDFSRKRSYLGQRPDVERKSREETYYRKRTGLFSGITNAIFGDKKDTRTVYYEDSSQRDQWDNEYRKLLNDYTGKKGDLDRKGREIRSQEIYLENYLKKIVDNKKQIDNNIKVLKNQIEMQKELLQKQEQANRKKFLIKLKSQIKSSIKIYFSEASENIRDSIEKACASHLRQVESLGLQYYEKVIQLRIKFLEKNESEKAQPVTQTYQINQQKLNQAITELEALI